MGLAIIAGVAGDLFLSKGMKELGDVSNLSLKNVLPFIIKVIGYPKIWMGTFFLACFFFLWLSVLSWADLSLALPLQAGTFILGPLCAQYFLNEQVSFVRWAGIFLISLGVVLVTWQPSVKTKESSDLKSSSRTEL
jgi:drug/metabolite transporter (DMT)-like permease